jgi:signal transduction histidine kinase
MNTRAAWRAVVRRHPHADLTVALVVWMAALLTAAAGRDVRVDAVAVATSAVACGSLALRRRYPVSVLAVSAGAAELYLFQFSGRSGVLIVVAPLIALFTVAEASTSGRALTIGLLSVAAFLGLHETARPAGWLGAENLALAALGGLAVAAGHASRNRRAYLAEVEARMRHAEGDRDAEAARRVTEERLRIARDLHDDVGHHLALIHVQARVADHLLDASPDRAREALAHVRDATATALAELGDTVSLLRQPDDPPEPAEPNGDLSAVERLLRTFRRSGLEITARIDGPTDAVPAPISQTAYRVLREALTNVCRHAGLASVHVRVTATTEEVVVAVTNQAGTRPAVPPAAPAGHGLVGMRERVAALGGSLSADRTAGEGFEVVAVLPVTAGPA